VAPPVNNRQYTYENRPFSRRGADVSPSVGTLEKSKKLATMTGLEPVLPKGNRFLIYRHNHLGHIVLGQFEILSLKTNINPNAQNDISDLQRGTDCFDSSHCLADIFGVSIVWRRNPFPISGTSTSDPE
jgi:hypothetical protein